MQKLWLDQIKCHISQVKVRLCCRNQPWALSFLCNRSHGSKSSPLVLYRHGHLTFTSSIWREKTAGGSQRVVVVAFAPLPPLLSPAPFPPFSTFLPPFLLLHFIFFFSRTASVTHHFCSHPMCQNSVTWPNLNASEMENSCAAHLSFLFSEFLFEYH